MPDRFPVGLRGRLSLSELESAIGSRIKPNAWWIGNGVNAAMRYERFSGTLDFSAHTVDGPVLSCSLEVRDGMISVDANEFNEIEVFLEMIADLNMISD